MRLAADLTASSPDCGLVRTLENLGKHSGEAGRHARDGGRKHRGRQRDDVARVCIPRLRRSCHDGFFGYQLQFCMYLYVEACLQGFSDFLLRIFRALQQAPVPTTLASTVGPLACLGSTRPMAHTRVAAMPPPSASSTCTNSPCWEARQQVSVPAFAGQATRTHSVWSRKSHTKWSHAGGLTTHAQVPEC